MGTNGKASSKIHELSLFKICFSIPSRSKTERSYFVLFFVTPLVQHTGSISVQEHPLHLLDTVQMCSSLDTREKVRTFPGCKHDGKDKQREKGTRETAGVSRVPWCFAWAAIHQVLKLLGNLFHYPYSHVIELWPGRAVGRGNKLPVCFLRGIEFISFRIK